jgi:hypothetical protein
LLWHRRFFAGLKPETISNGALHGERPDTRQALPFKSPERERIERLVLAEAVSKRWSVID